MYADTPLRSNALSLVPIVLQGVTHIAPAVGIVLTVQFITSLAGVTSPLAYAFAFVIVLLLGASLTQLAKHLPSAGGYYTYVSRTVHPRAGFLTAWLYFLYDPLTPAINLAFMGYFFENTLSAEWHVTWFKWWLFLIIGTALVTFVTYRGIRVSTRVIVALGVFEIAVVILLGITGLVHPGPPGLNFGSYNPANSLSGNGLFLGVVFSIFAFTGFEAIAPLAEESERPRRTVPRGILYSILIMGAFYLFSSWAMLIGWGTRDVQRLVSSSENPVFVLAKQLWGPVWILVFLAVINSIFAVSIASSNAATRVFFRMARSGALPEALGRVHPRFRTPTNAIIVMTLLTLGVGLGLGFWIGPAQELFMLGIAITLCLAAVYSLGNLGVFLYYTRERRAEFNIFLHALFPLLSTAALGFVSFKSMIPLPPMPLGAAPWIAAAMLISGAVVVYAISSTGKERWLRSAASVYGESGQAATSPATGLGGS